MSPEIQDPADFEYPYMTANSLQLKRYWVHTLVMFVLSLVPCVFVFSNFYYRVCLTCPWWLTLLVFPFELALLWFVFTFASLGVSWVFLSVVKLLHKPREGIFPRDPHDKDYKYWELRGAIKKYGLWATHKFPLPWLDMFAFMLYGVKSHGGTSFFDTWCDTEFLEIGNNTLLGLGAVVQTSMVIGEQLIIKKVVIGDRTLVGAYAQVAPGTIIGDDVMLGSLSTTAVGQVLESGYIYTGIPCRKFRKNRLAENLEYKKTDVDAVGRTIKDVHDHYGGKAGKFLKKRKAHREKKKAAREGRKQRRKLKPKPKNEDELDPAKSPVSKSADSSAQSGSSEETTTPEEPGNPDSSESSSVTNAGEDQIKDSGVSAEEK